MPRSPLRNLLVVTALLALMAGAVVLVTEAGHTGSASTALAHLPEHDSPAQVAVSLHILFSHRPQHVRVDGHGIDVRPTDNELLFTLDLPVEREIDIPLDVSWEPAATNQEARYFTRITIRQNHKEDQLVFFADQDAVFTDVFTIDTRSP